MKGHTPNARASALHVRATRRQDELHNSHIVSIESHSMQDGPSSPKNAPAGSRNGVSSERSGKSYGSTAKPGVEINNTGDPECTLIKCGAPRGFPPRRRVQQCHQLYHGQHWDLAPSVVVPLLKAPLGRVACEDRPGLLLDLTEHLKAQQARPCSSATRGAGEVTVSFFFRGASRCSRVSHRGPPAHQLTIVKAVVTTEGMLAGEAGYFGHAPPALPAC